MILQVTVSDLHIQMMVDYVLSWKRIDTTTLQTALCSLRTQTLEYYTLLCDTTGSVAHLSELADKFDNTVSVSEYCGAEYDVVPFDPLHQTATSFLLHPNSLSIVKFVETATV